MTDVATAPTGGEVVSAPIIQNIPAADAPAEFTTNQAAKALADLRWKRHNEAKEPAAESAPVATAAQELSGEDNAAPPVEATGETQEDAPAEQPPRELPRSWTKDRAEVWNRLDPAAQDILLEQDRKASAEVRRLQNEAAEERKAIKAEREAAEKARQEYEGKLPSLMEALHNASPFADIKSMADVEKMQAEDPFRFQQFQVYQWKMQAAQTELQQAEQRKTQEAQTKWSDFVKEQDKLLNENIAKADIDKYTPLAGNHLSEVGFTDSERNGFVTGEKISPFDHRMQRIILNSMKYEEMLKAPKAVAIAPLPPVQRPGTAKPAGSAVSERVQALNNKLTDSGKVNDAVALLIAKRNAARR